ASPIGVFAAPPPLVLLNETAMSGRSIFFNSDNGARVCRHCFWRLFHTYSQSGLASSRCFSKTVGEAARMKTPARSIVSREIPQA
ncbi:hypothetical protein, partial [Domibacillus tundrae]|uniref:hypothetical protein n=1 Tax=Domibacillus tundrae TaxID=1587527 RepID=UPI00339171EE